jgi:hypothetical protein
MNSRRLLTANNGKYHSREHLKAIVNAYGEMIWNYINDGWDAYMVSILFHQLAGSRKTKVLQMNYEIGRVYNRLATRMVRKASSPRWSGYCPIGFFVPDLPVPKKRKADKSTIADVSINDGLHMGGIILANRWARIQGSLVDHFKGEKDRYVTAKFEISGVPRQNQRDKLI